MTGLVVLQARTGSSRLPGKVLLPLAGIPLAVLAARRAENRGRRVIAAIPRDPTDDSLYRVLVDSGIQCYRGSLNNVLERFVEACSGLRGESIVIRLTADNPLPDGQFIDDVEADFVARRLDYLCTVGADSGLPYGISVEVTRLSHLREALSEATSEYDKEHVTPYVARKFGCNVFKGYNHLEMEHFRATIDTFEDYLCMSSVFSGSSDPILEPWSRLANRLKGRTDQPQVRRPATRLALGTAQLGMAYGITNCSNIDDEHRTGMIRTAIINGVVYLDTARAYGRSEELIGKTLSGGWASRANVVTKLDPLTDLLPTTHERTVRMAVECSILRSSAALTCPRLDVMLLHRAYHLKAWNGAAWCCLQEQKAEGRIRTLGVSVQTPDELREALDVESVDHIQLPFNVLDHRWESLIPAIEQARRNRSLVIHVRSAILQGLLASRNPQLWRQAHITTPNSVLKWTENLVSKLGRSDILDLCIAYLNSFTWIDAIVVGVDNNEQLMENLHRLSNPPLTDDEVAMLIETRPKLSEKTLNPALWMSAA